MIKAREGAVDMFNAVKKGEEAQIQQRVERRRYRKWWKNSKIRRNRQRITSEKNENE